MTGNWFGRYVEEGVSMKATTWIMIVVNNVFFGLWKNVLFSILKA